MGLYDIGPMRPVPSSGRDARSYLNDRRRSLASPAAGRVAGANLDPAQKSSMLASMARNTGGFISTVGDVIDTPGAIFRGALAGKPLSGFGSFEDRVSGQELLSSYGIINEDTNPYAATAAGFAAEVALDPFNIFFGAARALNVGGKAAKYAGLLDKAGDVAFAKLGKDTASRLSKLPKTRNTKRALKSLRKLQPEGELAAENMRYRPLIGPRQAQTNVTLRELVETGADAAEQKLRVSALENYLRPRGRTYNQVADETLGGAFGLGYFTPAITFNPKSAQPFLRRLDDIGQAARYSYPMRLGSALFDQRVMGNVDEVEQIAAMRHFDNMRNAERLGSAQAAQYLESVRTLPISKSAQQMLGADSLASEQGKAFVRRMWEGAENATDLRIAREIGEDKVRSLVNRWDSIVNQNVAEGNRLGMKSVKYSDPFGIRYVPRAAKELDFGEYGKGLNRAQYNTMMLEQEARKRRYMTPGGTQDLTEISSLPEVRALAELKATGEGDASVRQAAEAIKRFLDAKHSPGSAEARVAPFQSLARKLNPDGSPVREAVLNKDGTARLGKDGLPKTKIVRDTSSVIDVGQAEQIARMYRNMSKDLEEGAQLFGEHPLAGMARNMVSQSVARANAKHIYDTIAESAVYSAEGINNVKGGVYRPLTSAIGDIARRTRLAMDGNSPVEQVYDRVKESLAARFNIPFEEIDLSKFGVDDAVANRLTRIKDFYEKPRAQSEILDFLGKYTGLYKSFLLAFPSRHVRDMYSNAISVYLEVGDPVVAHQGFRVAKAVLAGNYDAAEDLLRQVPKYQSLTGDALRQTFVDDVSKSGILASLASSDLITANKTGRLNQLLPGMAPSTYATSLIPKSGAKASDLLTFKGIRLPGQTRRGSETKNALLVMSEQLSDYTDSVARLGGFVAMMKKGAAPEYASKRITAALVDYSSLTPFERNFMKSIFPWWSYNSRIGKYVVTSLMNNPGGGYAQMVRAMRVLQQSDEETYIPEALRQQFAIRIPEELKQYIGLPKGDGQTTTFLKDIDLPGMDVLSLIDPKPSAYGAVSGTLQNIANQISPPARALIEYATDTDFFSRRPLRQATTPLDRIYRSVSGSTQNLSPIVKTAANLLPTPRIAGLVSPLFDDRIPMQQRLLKSIVNAGTGVKLQDADQRWMVQEQRERAGDRLGDFMVDYTDSFIPEERIPQVPRELMPYYQLYRELGKELRGIRKTR